MLTRRTMIAGLGALTCLPALAQSDWRQSIKEIRFGVSSAEHEAGAIARNQPVIDYLTGKLGVPVKLYRVSDYAGLVEALRADQLEFARFGPAVYSLGRRVLGDKLQPLFRDIDNNGQQGYYSVIVVRADSPYRSVADLKGKNFAFADPNSTSGFAFPSYFLRKQGFDPQNHFGGTVFSGGHDNSVLALVRGQFDGVATYQVNEASGVVQRLAARNMIPAGATRVIWTSPLIPSSPFSTRANLPQGLKDAFVAAMKAMKNEAPEVWKVYTDGQVSAYAPAKHEDYLDVIAVTEELEARRKQKPAG
ncbi:putative PhnD protein, phosphonate ABC transporter, exported protein [Bosea sp. LC85]|uniref:phosphate/phosphite/phosphonate ABC transporter substrate-binding protein n=1 Tax=Bosea sp. LC85 TaxID=1502851 RepID=UPI0004E31410|nr:phosphate/phosphite/phosphonate ABC transporter substrate-binding protein [Bosea sp. LC85]KFC73340.1 putative PhnD protein, phosphonate ABC transporter, exported protein [Bosea sp. LC85]